MLIEKMLYWLGLEEAGRISSHLAKMWINYLLRVIEEDLQEVILQQSPIGFSTKFKAEEELTSKGSIEVVVDNLYFFG